MSLSCRCRVIVNVSDSRRNRMAQITQSIQRVFLFRLLRILGSEWRHSRGFRPGRILAGLAGCWQDVGRMLAGCWQDVGRIRKSDAFANKNLNIFRIKNNWPCVSAINYLLPIRLIIYPLLSDHLIDAGVRVPLESRSRAAWKPLGSRLGAVSTDPFAEQTVLSLGRDQTLNIN